MRPLGLLVTAFLLGACSGAHEQPADTPTTAAAPTTRPRPSLDDLPVGEPPGIGYVEHQEYVEPDGRRTTLPPRLGVSGIVPYAGGLLVADTRVFEGTVGLNLVRHGRVVATSCSAGVPTRTGGWVTWLTGSCPESADFVRAELHRARSDGSSETVRRISPRSVFEVGADAMTAPVPDLPRRWYASASAREDARHVLAVVVRGRQVAILRFGPGGAVERATPVERFDPGVPAYALGPGR